MRLINVNKENWVVDVEWEVLPNEGNLMGEMKEIAAQKKKMYGILLEYEGFSLVGLLEKNIKRGKNALALLSFANQLELSRNEDDFFKDWIVIEPVGDDEYWLGVVKHGLPAPGFDIIISFDKLKRMILDLLQVDTYRIYSKDLNVAAALQGTKEIFTLDINDLTREVSATYKVVKLTGLPNSVLYLMIGTVFTASALGAAYYFYDEYESNRQIQLAQEQMQNNILNQQMQTQNDILSYQNNVDSIKKQTIEALKAPFRYEQPIILSNIVSVLGNVKFGTNGWLIKSANCQAFVDGKVGSCTVVYSRTTIGTNKMIKSEIPDILINGDEATLILPLIGENVDLNGANDFDKVKTTDDFVIETVSQLQTLMFGGMGVVIEPSQEITFQGPPKPLTEEQKQQGLTVPIQETIGTGVSGGFVKISGENLTLLNDMGGAVSWNGMVADKVDITFDNNLNARWDIYLKYYIKKGDATEVGGSKTSLSSNKKDDDGYAEKK